VLTMSSLGSLAGEKWDEVTCGGSGRSNSRDPFLARTLSVNKPASVPNRQIQTFQDGNPTTRQSSTPHCLLRNPQAIISSIGAKKIVTNARQEDRREIPSTVRVRRGADAPTIPTSMTTIIRTRVPLETLSMSQPTARRRSKRLAGEIPWVQLLAALRALPFPY
jgi:hypothetical protein